MSMREVKKLVKYLAYSIVFHNRTIVDAPTSENTIIPK